MIKAVVFTTILVALWVGVLRPWLRPKPWMRWLFDAIEPVERALWLKSESIMWARWLTFTGTFLTVLANFDPSSLDTLMVFAPMLPESWQPYATGIVRVLPMVVTLAGLLQERLRRDTTKPLEVVAMRTDAPPEVKAAAIAADDHMQRVAEAVARSEQRS